MISPIGSSGNTSPSSYGNDPVAIAIGDLSQLEQWLSQLQQDHGNQAAMNYDISMINSYAAQLSSYAKQLPASAQPAVNRILLDLKTNLSQANQSQLNAFTVDALQALRALSSR